tara:strand:+ start:145 stop:831 length:687 start_codon:yes stop_codon:yes gene_type:complete
MSRRSNYIFLILFFLIISCKSSSDFLSKNNEENVFYEVIFKDKEKRKKVYRQSYSFLSQTKNSISKIKSNGEIIIFKQDKDGITKSNLRGNTLGMDEPNSKDISRVILAFPVKKGTKWITEDKTSLQMKLGYDRVYNTNLKFKAENIIEKIDDIISINGRRIKNCIKITSYGKTSFNPGPPLANINIEIATVTWYSKDLGILRYKREEKSDSETMGQIFYDKTMILDH